MSLLNNNIDDNELIGMFNFINKYYPDKYIIPESIYFKYLKKYREILILTVCVFIVLYMMKPFFIMKKEKNKYTDKIDYKSYIISSIIIIICITVSYKLYVYRK